MLEENKAIVRDFLMESNKEGRTIVELCVPNFMAHIGATPAMNLHDFQKFQTTYYASFSQSQITLEDMVAEDDKVAFRGVVRAVHTGDFNGIPVSGKSIAVPVIGMAKITDGKIVEWWNSPDRLSWMQQIGAVH